MMTNNAIASSSSPASAPAQGADDGSIKPKSAACTVCRSRKLRCDTNRPICGNCARTGVQHDCTYHPIQARRSRIQIMNEKIQDLEDQINTLELRASMHKNNSIPTGFAHPLGLQAPKHTYIVNSAFTCTLPNGYVPPLGDTRRMASWWKTGAPPPPDLSNLLIGTFVENQWQYGYEPYTPELIAMLQDTSIYPNSPLRNVVYLIGCFFCPPVLTASQNEFLQRVFLNRTRRTLEHALRWAERLLDFIEASHLLASYLYAKGRHVQGQATNATTMIMAMACGLDCLGGPYWGHDNTGGLLPPPEDLADLRRRLKIWWAIFCTDRAGCILKTVAPAVSDNKIDTAFGIPGESGSYSGTNTLKDLYTSECPATDVTHDSLDMMRVKGMALLHRASILGRHVAMHAHDPTFRHHFRLLDKALRRFLTSLPPVHDHTRVPYPGYVIEEGDINMFLVLPATCAFTAIIMLLDSMCAKEKEARRRCLEAARGVAAIVEALVAADATSSAILIFVPVCWEIVLRVLARELERLDPDSPQADAIKIDMHTIFMGLERRKSKFPAIASIKGDIAALQLSEE